MNRHDGASNHPGPGVSGASQEWARGDRSAARAFWSIEPEALLAQLGSSQKGLGNAQALLRLANRNPDDLERRSADSIAVLIYRQIANPMVLIMAIAALIAGFLGEWIETAIILAIVLISTLLGFSKEYRASAAMKALRNRLALQARVLRDGVAAEIPVSAVVTGDVICLSAGPIVPAVAIVLQAEDLLVSKETLAGERFPIEKRAGALSADRPPGSPADMVFIEASVRSGSERLVTNDTATCVSARNRRSTFCLSG